MQAMSSIFWPRCREQQMEGKMTDLSDGKITCIVLIWPVKPYMFCQEWEHIFRSKNNYWNQLSHILPQNANEMLKTKPLSISANNVDYFKCIYVYVLK